MENYTELMREANSDLKTADHMVYITYPLVNDPKMVMSILERLYNSLIKTIDAILDYDYLYKRISHVPSDIKEKLDLFKDFTIRRYNIDREILILINDLKDFLEFKKKSKVQFVRRENYVVCSSGYSTKTINISKMKSYVNQTKEFVLKIDKLLQNGL